MLETNPRHIKLGDIDYTKFKLFLLSILWRMGAASDPIWKEVTLGPHQEKIRQLLIAENPEAPDVYPCILTAVKLDGHFDLGWFLPPQSSRASGHRIVRVIINGMIFAFFVSSHSDQLKLGRVSINQNNEMILFVEEARKLPFVNEALNSLGEAIRRRDG